MSISPHLIAAPAPHVCVRIYIYLCVCVYSYMCVDALASRNFSLFCGPNHQSLAQRLGPFDCIRKCVDALAGVSGTNDLYAGMCL